MAPGTRTPNWGVRTSALPTEKLDVSPGSLAMKLPLPKSWHFQPWGV